MGFAEAVRARAAGRGATCPAVGLTTVKVGEREMLAAPAPQAATCNTKTVVKALASALITGFPKLCPSNAPGSILEGPRADKAERTIFSSL